MKHHPKQLFPATVVALPPPHQLIVVLVVQELG
jgi:hypothetical protein